MAHKIKLDTAQYQIVREALIHYAESLENGSIEPNIFKEAEQERKIAARMTNKEFVEQEDTETEDE